MPNTYQNQPSNSSVTAQQGAVLIVVLLFLVLIILAGAIAVRQSTTDLKLATSDQINALLLQSADNANQNIEQTINSDSGSDIYKDMMSISGPFGHFILDVDNLDNEYIFCFRPRGRFFDLNSTSILTSNGTILGTEDNNGYCNPNNPADYVSNRNTTMTQVSVSLTPPDFENEAFGSYTIGQDSSEISSQAFMFDINSTAVLPAYADAKIGDDNCFEQTSRLHTVDNASETIGGCMAKAGVPSTVVYEQVSVENQSLRTKCVDFGAGDGKLLCTLP